MPAASRIVSIASPNYSRRYVAYIEVCVLDYYWWGRWDISSEVNEIEDMSVIIWFEFFVICLYE